jgi:hypothetical protein
MNLCTRARHLVILAVVPFILACTPSLGASATVVDDAPPLSTVRQVESVAPAPVSEAVILQEHTIRLLTYPYERYQQVVIDPRYRWPYQKFDMERFRAKSPTPEPRTYRQIVLANAYLQLQILPELGGRIWQVIHKPSGAPMFYQNQVVKPTHWGQADQQGWLALGGLEWGVPVVEHGYDWGAAWEYTVVQADATQTVVKLSTPQDGRLLQVSILIALANDAAYFVVMPTLTNTSQQALDFSFWSDAMLAPGSDGQPSEQLHFVLPTTQVTIHSTNDADLPAPGQTITWPRYGGRDLSRLGNWRQYLGFFESPAAHGPFAGVYDPAYDAGAVRVFPPEVAQGSKIFALGWSDALTSDNFTDDTSRYVELHGGLAPTFFDQAQLGPGESISWREVWYPVQGIGDLVAADEVGALNVTPVSTGVAVQFYPTQFVQGELVVTVADAAPVRVPIQTVPAAPVNQVIPLDQPLRGSLTVRVEDGEQRVLLSYTK